MTRRTDQINALLREEISNLVREDIKDPRLGGLITVTRVDVSPDLRNARAYISVLGSEDERDGTLKALERARPFVRRELGRRLNLRNTPDVHFYADTSMERAQELTDLMKRTAEERGEAL